MNTRTTTKQMTSPQAADGPQADVEPPEVPEESTGTVVPADEGSDGDEDGDDGPNAEAARYRRRLRDAEAERDMALAERDAARAELLAAFVARGSNLAPSALTEEGVVPRWEDVAGQDGTVDGARIAAHLRDLRAARPHLFASHIDTAQGRTRDAAAVGPRDRLAAALSPQGE